jgi:hypothetical protein
MTLRPQISLGLRFSVSRAALIALDPSGVNPKLLFGRLPALACKRDQAPLLRSVYETNDLFRSVVVISSNLFRFNPDGLFDHAATSSQLVVHCRGLPKARTRPPSQTTVKQSNLATQRRPKDP